MGYDPLPTRDEIRAAVCDEVLSDIADRLSKLDGVTASVDEVDLDGSAPQIVHGSLDLTLTGLVLSPCDRQTIETLLEAVRSIEGELMDWRRDLLPANHPDARRPKAVT